MGINASAKKTVVAASRLPEKSVSTVFKREPSIAMAIALITREIAEA